MVAVAQAPEGPVRSPDILIAELRVAWWPTGYLGSYARSTEEAAEQWSDPKWRRWRKWA